MTDSESHALFRICSVLQKEIRDIKNDNDELWGAIDDLQREISNFDHERKR